MQIDECRMQNKKDRTDERNSEVVRGQRSVIRAMISPTTEPWKIKNRQQQLRLGNFSFQESGCPMIGSSPAMQPGSKNSRAAERPQHQHALPHSIGKCSTTGPEFRLSQASGSQVSRTSLTVVPQTLSLKIDRVYGDFARLLGSCWREISLAVTRLMQVRYVTTIIPRFHFHTTI